MLEYISIIYGCPKKVCKFGEWIAKANTTHEYKTIYPSKIFLFRKVLEFWHMIDVFGNLQFDETNLSIYIYLYSLIEQDLRV